MAIVLSSSGFYRIPASDVMWIVQPLLQGLISAWKTDN